MFAMCYFPSIVILMKQQFLDLDLMPGIQTCRPVIASNFAVFKDSQRTEGLKINWENFLSRDQMVKNGKIAANHITG